MKWVHESTPVWDAQKSKIIGAAPEGSVPALPSVSGALLPGDWWHVEHNGQIVGYGWMDIVWGDGEVLLVVRSDMQGTGVGTFIIEQLAREANKQGLNYIYNRIHSAHPQRSTVARWLGERSFTPDRDGERWSRKVA